MNEFLPRLARQSLDERLRVMPAVVMTGGARARAGLLLHEGDAVEWLTPDVLAAPWWRVI